MGKKKCGKTFFCKKRFSRTLSKKRQKGIIKTSDSSLPEVVFFILPLLVVLSRAAKFQIRYAPEQG